MTPVALFSEACAADTGNLRSADCTLIRNGERPGLRQTRVFSNSNSMLLTLFIHFFERFPIRSFPRDESIRAPTVYDGRCSRWAGEFSIL